jgi:hypothetical protein
MSSWLNSKRIRDYPRLVFIASWVVLLLNLIFHRGWIGGLTNYLVFGDFIVYYAAGKLYINNIAQLYDLNVQEITQLNLLGLTNPIGLSIYSYPPNAALLHSAVSHIPLILSIVFWCALAIFCVLLAARLMKQYLVPDWLFHKGLSTFQLSILILSSFSFIEGFEKGQTHALTLLLIVLIIISMKRDRWFMAGLFAALATYKPHFILGFLILWLIWGKYKAILGFIITSMIWNGAVLLTKGIDPYLAFLKLGSQVVYLPYTSGGFPNFIMVTPFSLVATALPFSIAPIWNTVFLFIGIILIIFFVVVAFKAKKNDTADQNLILAMAILLPLIVFTHGMLHDLLLLFPVFLLLSPPQEHGREFKVLVIVIYIAVLILPLLGFVFNIALAALIPIAVYIACFRQSLRLLRI